MLLSASLSDYVKALASGQPSPGGGAAAALTAAQSAALVSMVCRFTTGRKKFASFDESTRDALTRADEIANACLRAVDADADAYAAVAVALKLPKVDSSASLDDMNGRELRLQAALVAAADIPAAVAGLCVEIMLLVGKLAGRSNPTVASDLSVSLELAWAALKSALVNVDVNLKFLHDLDVVKDYQLKVNSLRQEGESIRNEAESALMEYTA